MSDASDWALRFDPYCGRDGAWEILLRGAVVATWCSALGFGWEGLPPAETEGNLDAWEQALAANAQDAERKRLAADRARNGRY